MSKHECSTWNIGPAGYPTSVAGCEQLSAVVRTDEELLSEGWADGTGTGAVSPLCGPIAVKLPDDAILVDSGRRTHLRAMASPRFAHRGGQDASDLTLEMAANALLAFHYGDAMTLDVMREVTRPDGVTSGWDSVVKADRAAHRGKARYQLRSHRYGGNGAFTVDASGECTDTRAITYVLGQPLRFVGHHAVHGTADTMRKARARAATATRRVGKVGKRGPAVTPFDQGKTAHYATWKNADALVIATAADIEAILRTSAVGADIALDQQHTVTVFAATVTSEGRTFTIREYARRAALAGVTID